MDPSCEHTLLPTVSHRPCRFLVHLCPDLHSAHSNVLRRLFGKCLKCYRDSKRHETHCNSAHPDPRDNLEFHRKCVFHSCTCCCHSESHSGHRHYTEPHRIDPGNQRGHHRPNHWGGSAYDRTGNPRKRDSGPEVLPHAPPDCPHIHQHWLTQRISDKSDIPADLGRTHRRRNCNVSLFQRIDSCKVERLLQLAHI